MSHLFIDVEVAPKAASDPAVAAKLAEVCPVDIYAVGDDGGDAAPERALGDERSGAFDLGQLGHRARG